MTGDGHDEEKKMSENPAILRKLAKARAEYADNDACPEDWAITIRHEAHIFGAVADALDGTVRWSDLVADYAPSWRWQEFGEHDPKPELSARIRANIDGAGSLPQGDE